MITSTRLGLIEDIVISIVLFLVVSLRNTDGTVIQGANSLGDKQSLKGDGYRARKSFNKAESILENAVEYLREVISYNSNLRLWIDREVGFGIGVEYCPVGIPRPVWSKSNNKSQSFFPKVTKRDIARGMLRAELEKLVGNEPFEPINLGFITKRSFNISSFSGFKF